ncbi:MAG: FeoB-associated Cys-rich membrane protein [Oscillospiraceae bacterium]|jgi:hypothetical protein|nr:FeoB-associated Cys-rich membrane protein [Oscillospiraceae bacterium]
MFEYLLYNLGTIIVSLVILGIITAIVASMISDKRKGKNIACNCGCGSCPKASACRSTSNKKQPHIPG